MLFIKKDYWDKELLTKIVEYDIIIEKILKKGENVKWVKKIMF